MNPVENKRYQTHKIVPVGDAGDSDCLITYSKRAAEFNAEDFSKKLSDVYRQVHEQDAFGLVCLRHEQFEFVIENTNVGYGIRAFEYGRPSFGLDKTGFGFTLGDLLRQPAL